MFNNYGFTELGELLEHDEADWSEYDERVGPQGRPRQNRPLPKPPHGNPVPSQPQAGYATKSELQATASRLDGRIATNSKAISTLESRTGSLASDHARLSMHVKREIAERKTVTDGLKKGLDEARQMAILLPLLSSQETKTVGGVENVVIDSGDSFSKILPILLLSGGFGGSSTTGGGGLFGGGGDGGIATLAIVMALSGKK